MVMLTQLCRQCLRWVFEMGVCVCVYVCGVSFNDPIPYLDAVDPFDGRTYALRKVRGQSASNRARKLRRSYRDNPRYGRRGDIEQLVWLRMEFIAKG